MKVIIAGSRSYFPGYDCIASLVQSTGWSISEIVSGKADGVDRAGEEYAEFSGIPVKPFPADWDTCGNAAGPIRNKAMAKYADGLILIWSGKSKGSASMLREAKAAGLKILEAKLSTLESTS